MTRLLLRLLAVGICAGIGAMAGWATIEGLDWRGTGASIVAVVIAMAVATLVWIGGIVLIRARGNSRDG